MTRWETAPADGGIHWADQEDDARKRAEAVELERHMLHLHYQLSAKAKTLVKEIGPMHEAQGVVRQWVIDTLYWALREGVRQAERGAVAEKILETGRPGW